MKNNELEPDLLRDIALFVEVAKANSFSVAATRLGMPNSSLSVRISHFEKALGLRLFHRSTRQISLTDEGFTYLSRCEPILEEARAATLELRDRSHSARGHLRLSMPVDFGVLMVAPAVAAFSRLYPEITFDFDTSPGRIDLVSEQCDIAIRMGELPDSSLTSRRLGYMSRGLYASPEYLRRCGVPAHPSELFKHDCVRLGAASTLISWTFERHEERVEVPVNGRFWANNYGMTRQLAHEGACMAMLIDTFSGDDVRAGRLLRVLPEWTIPPVPVSTVMPTRMLPLKTRLFLEFINDAFRTLTQTEM